MVLVSHDLACRIWSYISILKLGVCLRDLKLMFSCGSSRFNSHKLMVTQTEVAPDHCQLYPPVEKPQTCICFSLGRAVNHEVSYKPSVKEQQQVEFGCLSARSCYSCQHVWIILFSVTTYA